LQCERNIAKKTNKILKTILFSIGNIYLCQLLTGINI